jgi:hypothetical protein
LRILSKVLQHCFPQLLYPIRLISIDVDTYVTLIFGG